MGGNQSMKKHIKCINVITLLLCSLLLLSACADPPALRNPSPSVSPTGENNPSAENTGGITEPLQLDPDYEPGTESYPGGMSTLQGFSEYREFVRKYRMPEHFVAYEDIAALGQFTSLVFRPQEYLYNMRDSSGQKTKITVYHSKCHGLDKLTYSRSDNEDMREMNGKSGTWTYQKIGPLSYHYYENRLIFVYMESEHLEFWITGGEQIHLYDTTKDTALSRLLTRSTAEAEAKALLAKIEG